MKKEQKSLEKIFWPRKTVHDNEKFRNKPSLLNEPSFEPQVIKNVPPRIGHIKRSKFSSTSTLFVSTNCILAPDVDDTLRCLSVALYYMVKEAENACPKVFRDIFSEEKHPLGDNKMNLKKSPEISDVHEFLYLIYHGERLSAETAVMALAYIERLIALTEITLHASNWRRICLGATIIASKVWEDMAVWNSDYLEVFPNLKTADLAVLEREYLIALQFTVTLKPSVYVKYYFQLRSIADRDERNFPLQPISKERAAAIELRSQGVEQKARGHVLHRSNSLDPYRKKNKSIAIEDLSRGIKISEDN